jgi:hypothetical protein
MTADVLPVLGTMKFIDPRTVWPHKAHNFTPWLLANAAVLGEVLGMDLVLTAAEHPVGGFALDLIDRDEATGEMVIVENQLEATDHGHLGQLLTYAGGTDPVNVVWLATRFREEHRAALDWLNTRTNAETRFFGVEINAVCIGDSSPAPLLRLVAQPNDWGKQVKAAAHETAASERALAYQEFWNRFLGLVHQQQPSWTQAQKGQPQNWQSLPAGAAGFGYTCSFTKSGLCSELYFQHPDPSVNETRFAAQSRREQLEAAYGDTLTFDPLVGKKGCRIAAYRPGDITAQGQWGDYAEWFLAAQRRLREAAQAVGGLTAFTAA